MGCKPDLPRNNLFHFETQKYGIRGSVNTRLTIETYQRNKRFQRDLGPMAFWPDQFAICALRARRSGPVVRFVAALLAVILALSGKGLAAAEQEAAQPLKALAMKIVGDASRIRAVVEFDRKPDRADRLLLASPYRLVIDLPETVFAFSPASTQARGMLAGVRYGLIEEGNSRLILNFDTPFIAERVETLQDSDGHRLVMDIVAASREQFDAQIGAQIKTNSVGETTSKGDRLGTAEPRTAKPFTVVIDPGHGGIDPGAKGRSGTIEKDITLEFSERLREMLGKNSGFRLEMTRDKDVFLRLDERVRIARQYEADLLISVHADTIRFKDIRGATVYTISDKASDSLAQEIADGENKADEIAGMTIADEAEGVADILIDLARRETQTLSIGVAQKVVSSLKGEVELINNPHRFAGFRVLRAPDVPSILLELGYLSNPQDEALLKNDSWRDNVAEKLAEAVEAYAKMVRSTAQVAP